MTRSLPFEDFILIVAPCPTGAPAHEGWMSRIRAVDRIFGSSQRIYVDPYTGATAGPPVPQAHNESLVEYRLALTRPDHHMLLETLVKASRFVYVHTAHLARYLLPFYPTGKIVTDMHGIVPEEERMLGRTELGTYYEGVERVVLKCSRLVVVVTDAMRDHLSAKHPDCNATFLCLPIIETFATGLGDRRPRQAGTPYRLIYAGGTQVWQNIERTIDLCDRVADVATCTFLSLDHERIKSMAGGRPFARSARFEVVGKDELPLRYLSADLGFVLREDTAVNRVSCPTKLSEYLWFGVVPIVASPDIGDFAAEGYAYVTDAELEIGLIPDEATCHDMRLRNRAVLDRLIARYEASAAVLADLRLPSLVHGGGLAGLPIGSRHLLFPNQAELYVFAAGMHHFVRDVVDFYDEMRWEPGVEAPAANLRLVPLLADITVELRSVEVVASAAPSPELTVSCTTPGTPAGQAIKIERRAPFVDLNFSDKIAVSAVTARWSFREASDARDSEARPQDVAVTVRHGDATPLTLSAPVAFLGYKP